MNLSGLVAACQGRDDVTIKGLIESTDEYQAVVRDVASPHNARDRRNMFNAGILLVRGERTIPREAMIQAAEQGMVADAAQAAAASGRVLTWVPSGPMNEIQYDRNDSFVKFLDGAELKLNDPNTRLNCWEALVVAAINGAVLANGTALVTLYQRDRALFFKALTQALVAGAGRAYRPGQFLGTPVCGDIVLFDGLSHVAIANGIGDGAGRQVFSFWPAPAVEATDFGRDGTRTPMVLTTIEALSAWMIRNFRKAPAVTFGSPDWQALNQK